MNLINFVRFLFSLYRFFVSVIFSHFSSICSSNLWITLLSSAHCSHSYANLSHLLVSIHFCPASINSFYILQNDFNIWYQPIHLIFELQTSIHFFNINKMVSCAKKSGFGCKTNTPNVCASPITHGRRSAECWHRRVM